MQKSISKLFASSLLLGVLGFSLLPLNITHAAAKMRVSSYSVPLNTTVGTPHNINLTCKNEGNLAANVLFSISFFSFLNVNEDNDNKYNYVTVNSATVNGVSYTEAQVNQGNNDYGLTTPINLAPGASFNVVLNVTPNKTFIGFYTVS